MTRAQDVVWAGAIALVASVGGGFPTGEQGRLTVERGERYAPTG